MAAYSDINALSIIQKKLVIMFQNTRANCTEDLLVITDAINQLTNEGGSIYEIENMFYKIASNPRYNCNIDWCNIITNYISDGKVFGKDSILEFSETERDVFSLLKVFMRNDKKKNYYREYVLSDYEYLIDLIYVTKMLINDLIAAQNGQLEELIEPNIEQVVLSSLSTIIDWVIKMQDRYERVANPIVDSSKLEAGIANNPFWQNNYALIEKILYKHLQPIYNKILEIARPQGNIVLSSFDDFYSSYPILVDAYLGVNWDSIQNSNISFQEVEDMLSSNIKFIQNGLVSIEKEINKMFNSILVYNLIKLGNVKKTKIKILP